MALLHQKYKLIGCKIGFQIVFKLKKIKSLYL
jgi:hypothetical protein